jgi:hypothetical protein
VISERSPSWIIFQRECYELQDRPESTRPANDPRNSPTRTAAAKNPRTTHILGTVHAVAGVARSGAPLLVPPTLTSTYSRLTLSSRTGAEWIVA